MRTDDQPITISSPTVADAGEILTVQRAAYVSEAQLYDNPTFTALTETVADVHTAVEAGGVLIARHGTRIVGAVRGELAHGTCEVGRLVVAPDMQRRGIGRTLLEAIESKFSHADRFELFTGDRSAANIRLYERAGYIRTRVVPIADTVSLIYLEKPARG